MTTRSSKPYDDWSLEEKRVALAEVNTARQVFNTASAVWLWTKLGFPIPPRHLRPAWWQTDFLEQLPDNSAD